MEKSYTQNTDSETVRNLEKLNFFFKLIKLLTK